MGVARLWKYLAEHADALAVGIECEPVVAGVPGEMSTIIIDDLGFMITLAAEVDKRHAKVCERLGFPAYTDAAVVGGDLQPLRDALVFIVKRLEHVYRIKLVFALDVPQGVRSDRRARDAVREERASQGEVIKEELVEYCRGKINQKSSKSRTPGTPAQMRMQFLETLRSLPVEMRQLDDEVDDHIGALVHEFEPLCVFSNDTDLVVTRGVPVVLTSTLPWSAMLFGWAPFGVPEGGGDAPTLSLKVFSAERLWAHLGLASASDLYLAASLCGNDVVSIDEAKRFRTKQTLPYTIADAAEQVRDRVPGQPIPLLMSDSVEKYRRAARRQPRASGLDDADEATFQQLVEDKLPVGHIAKIHSNLCDDGAPGLLVGGKYIHRRELFTFKLLRHAEYYIFGHSSITVNRAGRASQEEPFTFPEDVVVRWNSDAYRRKRTPEEKVKALGPVFTMTPESCTTLLRYESQRGDPRAPLRPPLSVALLLWVLHAGCVSLDEVRLIATMVVLVHMSEFGNTEPNLHALATRAMIRGLPCAKRRPSLRTLELSRLFAKACGATVSLLELLQVRSDVGFPEVADLFSGTLLHGLVSRLPFSLPELLCRAVSIGGRDDSAGTIDEIEQSVEELCGMLSSAFTDVKFYEETISESRKFPTQAEWEHDHPPPLCCFYCRETPTCDFTSETCLYAHDRRAGAKRECNRGAKCNHGHGRPPRPCCMFLQGKCSYGADCHSPHTRLVDFCSFGDSCRVGHNRHRRHHK